MEVKRGFVTYMSTVAIEGSFYVFICDDYFYDNGIDKSNSKLFQFEKVITR